MPALPAAGVDVICGMNLPRSELYPNPLTAGAAGGVDAFIISAPVLVGLGGSIVPDVGAVVGSGLVAEPEDPPLFPPPLPEGAAGGLAGDGEDVAAGGGEDVAAGGGEVLAGGGVVTAGVGAAILLASASVFGILSGSSAFLTSSPVGGDLGSTF